MIAVRASLSTHEYLVSWPVIKLKLEGSSQKQVIASQNLIVLVVSLSVTHLEVYAVKRLSFGMLKNSFIFMKKIWLFEMHMKSKKTVKQVIFLRIIRVDIQPFRLSFPEKNVRYINRTLQIYEVVYNPGDDSHILFRHISCGCKNCLSRVYASCEQISQSIQGCSSCNNHAKTCFQQKYEFYFNEQDSNGTLACA